MCKHKWEKQDKFLEIKKWAWLWGMIMIFIISFILTIIVPIKIGSG